MSSPNNFNTDEPFWALPSSVSERLQSRQRNTAFNAFVLCGVYCAVAIFFLFIFGIAAFQREESGFATVIFSFAGVTALCYGVIWLSKQYHLASHLVALIMASLCLYLFHTGGTGGTGPVFFMAFPMVAVFLQGFFTGFIYIVLMSVITLFIYMTGFWGFDREQYEFVFLSRIATVFVITSFLALLYSYFKYLSERDLLLIYDDLEQLTFADQKTGIANRNLMQKLIMNEYKRFQRYGLKFSLMLVTLDSFNKFKSQYGQDAGDSVYRTVADVFQRVLRKPDIPSLWDREDFLILLPHTGKESARIVGERLCEQISKHQFYINNKAETATASIGIVEVSDEDIADTLQKLEMNLYKAIKQEGNQVVSE